MKDLKNILESVFFAQNNKTITLSLEAAMAEAGEDKTIYDVMDKMKAVLESIGIENVSYHPDMMKVVIVTTEEMFDEVQKIAKDFGAVPV